MPNAAEIKNFIHSDEGTRILKGLYPSGEPRVFAERICNLTDTFTGLYGDSGGISVFSAPGRTEIGGNHTDHNHGKVLAASVDLDTIAVARKNDDMMIRLHSEGYPDVFVDLSCLSPIESEIGQSDALVRGICSSFAEKGLPIGGMNIVTTSNVLAGAGLSSSAAFEVLFCAILSGMYKGDTLPAIEAAIISRFAENKYFGKPCGLMDQAACAHGGLIAIDFIDPERPSVEKIAFDFPSAGLKLCITDTGGNHADLTAHYAAIPSEMRSVAMALGSSYLAEADESLFWKQIPEIREKAGDRAVLRALHFFEENRRVDAEKEALRSGDPDTFLRLVNESGNSSFKYLQNIYDHTNSYEQAITLGLAISDTTLRGRGASRVHGGGFAGTIQAFVPEDLVDTYKRRMESVFGDGSCHTLSIRTPGSVKII